MPDEQTPQLDLGLKKALDNLEKDPYLDLAKQVKAEYDLAWNHQKPKKDEALLRLKLYNNQKRDKSAAGDTTMFTIHQTLLASLYVDKLQSEWVGREEGDDEVANNLTAMADYDYDEMGKDETDFDWIWDTLFFGRAPLNFSEYIRDPDTNIFLPVPESIDPITFLHDPRGVSINGNRMGRNACRFYGREIKMGRDEMEKHPHFLANLDFTKIHFGSGTRSLIEEGARARADAQGNQYERNKAEAKLGVNGEYDITEWCTHFKFGGVVKKCKVWLANNRKEVVGLQIFKGDKWTVLDRSLYPTSHDWDGTSIPDLTEDKQRARAVAQNLGMQAMKADLYPMYIYDTNKIKNKNDLAFNFNKFIPSDGDASNAAFALRKAFPNLPLLNFIYNSLDISAQKACYSEDTQTLTENGWKYFWEYKKGEKIATLNTRTNKIEYHLPKKMFVYEHDGEMYHYKKDDSVDLLVSPEHQLWYRSADYKKLKKDNGWKLEPANKINLKNIQFLTGADWDAEEVVNNWRNERIEMDVWTEFLGYFVSEGCVYFGTKDKKQNRINIAQKEGETCIKIEECLRKLPVKVNKRKNKEGYIHFDFYDEAIAQWLEKKIGRYSYGKHLPQSLKMLPKRQLKIFFDAYMAGDGSWDNREGRSSGYFSTVSKVLADDLQEICLKIGYKSKLIERVDKRSGNRFPYYRVSICDRTTPEVRLEKNLKVINYKGSIYCFEVPNHLFITRRNGIIAIQGNTATPEIQQGQMSQEKRTLGEINIVASKVDTRYSLSAKVFGWSERRFWLQWYNLYKENFKEGIDEKMVRLVGAFGDKWRPFTKENIVTKRLDPDVKIESSYVSRAKQLEERQGTISLLNIILQDPTSNRRYAERKVAKQYGWSKDEIERLLPPTIDERIAEDQNAFLSKNKTVPVLPEDDHNVHLEIHSKASATPATYAHVETHKKALSIKKTKPELFPVDQSMVTFQNPNQRNMPATQLPGQVKAVQPSQTSNQSAPAPMMQ